MNAPISPDPAELCVDLANSSHLQLMEIVREQRLRASPCDETSSLDDSFPILALKIIGPAGKDYIGCGMRGVKKTTVSGPIGDFAFAAFEAGDFRIDGKVGSFLGHSIRSGIVIVNGHADHAVGTLGTGGTIAVYGNAGDRVAAYLSGAEVVIRGSVGELAGLGMKKGCLIIGGNAGPRLGHHMLNGTIYVRGEIESLSSHVEEVRMREPDRLKIGLLMLKAGIKSAGKEFRVFRAIQGEV